MFNVTIPSMKEILIRRFLSRVKCVRYAVMYLFFAYSAKHQGW